MKYLSIICISLFVLIGYSTSEGKQPNIIVIITDQERYHMHWPKDWAKQHLPGMQRLQNKGLTFTHAYTSACACSPSRAVMMTSQHYPENAVNQTAPMSPLPTAQELIDIGWLLSQKAGYEVVWKGKWHLSYPEDSEFVWAEDDIANLKKNYFLSQWNPPDAGTAMREFEWNRIKNLFPGLSTLGGGFANNDGRFVRGNLKDRPKETRGFGESILEYIHKVASKDPEERQPFCLFISLVNPHDIWVYPNAWEKAGYKKQDFAKLGISLPSNYTDDLQTKPVIQRQMREAYNLIAPLGGMQGSLEYVNFYAYLNALVDKHIMTILDAVDEAGFTENTIIIRTSDHGEAGLSHGLREKAYAAYEEIIHVPLVVSNPLLFPTAQTTDAFYSHLDLFPTLAELAGVPDFDKYGKGVSIVPVLKNPSTSVQEGILFAFDDLMFITLEAKRWHIRALREGDWMYAVYYLKDGSEFEYEMYNLKNDPGELKNLLHGTPTPENAAMAQILHQKLTQKIQDSQALPEGIKWPTRFKPL